MADWNQPTVTSSYLTEVLQILKERDVDSVSLLKSDPANASDGMVKLVRSPVKFQERISGTFTDIILGVEGGGTGGNSASSARTALGLGSMAIQNDSAVSITGGTLAGSGAGLTNLNASSIATGTLASARLPDIIEGKEIKNYSETVQIPTLGSTTYLNFQNGNVASFTLNQSMTIVFQNPPVAGKSGSMMVVITQSAGGGLTVAWSGVVWPYGNAPIMTATANKRDIYVISTVNAGSPYFGAVYGQNY